MRSPATSCAPSTSCCSDDEFYDEIFRELGIPYEPVRWRTDNPDSIEDKNARVIELIAAYRNRGHLMADIDPLRLDKARFRSHPDLDVQTHGLTLWDLDRVFKVNGFAGAEYKKLRDVLGLLRDSYCRHVGVEYTHILEPEQQKWLQERIEVKHEKPTVAQQKYILSKLNAAEAFETFLQTKYVGQKRFSLEGAETVIPMMDAAIDQCRRARARRGGHRHAAPRPAQRAGQHRRQAVLADLQRVRGQPEPVAGARLRRRQVPPRRRPATTCRCSATTTFRSR